METDKSTCGGVSSMTWQGFGGRREVNTMTCQGFGDPRKY